MAHSVKFSVLMPVYNVKRYLSECLDSVLNQTYDNYEIIIIDDGSFDGSETICDNYSQRYDSIHLLHQHNQGLMMARRRAITLATGDYCVFIDSDDWVSRDLMEKLNNQIGADSPDVVFFNKSLYFEANNQYVEKKPLFISKNPNIKDIKSKLLLSDDLNNLVIKCVKTSLLRKDVFDYSTICSNSIGEDLIQSFSIVDLGKTFVYLDECLYFYRQYPKSMSKEFSLDNLKKEFSKFNIAIWNFRINYCRRWFEHSEEMMNKVLNYYAYSIVQHFYRGYSFCCYKDQKNEWIGLPWNSFCNADLKNAIEKNHIQPFIKLQICSILKRHIFILSILLVLRRIKDRLLASRNSGKVFF